MSIKQLSNAISKTKKALITKASKNGLYENFGQKEVGKLEEKYIDICLYSQDENAKRHMINNFNNWCMDYQGRIC